VTVQFSAANYQTKTLGANVSPGETQTVSTPLVPKSTGPGGLSGVISNHSTSHPLNGARATLSGAGNATATSDSLGVYHFDALPQGTYTVQASAEGFAGQYQVIDITALTTQQADFSLVPGALLTPQLEDIDGNGKVDAVDVQLVINAALDLAITGNADINRDGDINAIDVQLTINAALGLPK
jgi:hypothetical protein